MDLTWRYSITQFFFWAASTGIASFSTTYLLNLGLDTGMTGFCIGATGLLSCIAQPVLAGFADRSDRFVLPQMLGGLSIVCIASFAVQLFADVSLWLRCACYMLGMWSSDTMVPLLNAYGVSYQKAGFQIRYGVARGIGSAASAMISLVLGFVIANFGAQWMIVLLMLFRLLSILPLFYYPPMCMKQTPEHKAQDGCSIWQFIVRYRWYCTSLAGIAFLGMFHAMTENYLIAILGRFGGTSAHVGIALFLASLVGTPVIMGYQFFQKRIHEHNLLRIAAVSFCGKAVLLYFASSIAEIYAIQLLQMTSYAFLAPTQVFFAMEKVRSADLVKGQAFLTAAYALGCAAGNIAGGELLTGGVDRLLLAGIGMTFLGCAILFLSVDKLDHKTASPY